MINPKDFVAWLTTQPNANGSLYLERVANAYANALRLTPKKLDLNLPDNECNVYACETLSDFEKLRKLFLASPNFKSVNQKCAHGAFSAGLNCYARYLRHLENNCDNDTLVKLKKKGDKTKSLTECKKQITTINNKIKQVDFNEMVNFSDTHPISCVIDGKKIEAKSWGQMFVCIVERLLVCRNKSISALKVNHKNGDTHLFLMSSPIKGLRCKRISNDKYINVNFSANQFVKLIGKLCECCSVNTSTLELTYADCEVIKNTTVTDKQETLTPPESPKTNIPTNKINCQEQENILMVLKEKYVNGIRFESPIELGRLRKFMFKRYGTRLHLTDNELSEVLKSLGRKFDDKIYIISTETKKRIKSIADDYFAGGAKVIFYTAFFESHESWLFESSIVSVVMLTEIFCELYPKLYFKSLYFGQTNDHINLIMISEILRTWGDNVLLTYSQISNRLPYIPYEKIKLFLGQNGDFIINKRGWGDTDGEFTHISKIIITSEEKEYIKQTVLKNCLEYRYMSFVDLDLAEIVEKNYEISIAAIHTAIYQICLDGKNGNYNRSGKIITLKGENIDASYIIKEYCKKQEKVELEDLLQLEVKITGEQHRWIPMQAGYDTMIRIDKETFVADKFLNFETSEIDNVIELFFNSNEYIPLKAVTTFAMFPYCGQAWNLFLLESYVRRFSRNFRFETPSVNSKNIGCIVRKHSKLSYDDIMVHAVCKSGINLDNATVDSFLIEEGYRANPSKSKTSQIINIAKTIRKRGN